jgi:hypothetical protein
MESALSKTKLRRVVATQTAIATNLAFDALRRDSFDRFLMNSDDRLIFMFAKREGETQAACAALPNQAVDSSSRFF